MVQKYWEYVNQMKTAIVQQTLFVNFVILTNSLVFISKVKIFLKKKKEFVVITNFRLLETYEEFLLSQLLKIFTERRNA